MWKYYISTIGRKNNFFYPRLVSFTYHNGQTTLISDCQIPNGNNYFPIPPIPVLCVEVSLEESEGVLIQVFLLYFFCSPLSTPYSQMKSRTESKGLVGWSEVRWVLILFSFPPFFPYLLLIVSLVLWCRVGKRRIECQVVNRPIFMHNIMSAVEMLFFLLIQRLKNDLNISWFLFFYSSVLWWGRIFCATVLSKGKKGFTFLYFSICILRFYHLKYILKGSRGRTYKYTVLLLPFLRIIAMKKKSVVGDLISISNSTIVVWVFVIQISF